MVVLKQSNSLDVEWKAIKEYDYYYKIYLNDILIGTAGISVNSDDMLYIYIDEKYRGNNLGKESFDKITQKFREFNIEKIKLVIDNNNIQMIRILNHYKHKIIISGQTFKYYEIGL